MWPGECGWGLWPFCYFCCHALSDVCEWRRRPLSPVSPPHEKFRPTPLFKPFLMKGAQKWNWLMPNEYHWSAVIVALTFVTLQLFIEHRFHFERGLAAKCAPGPLRHVLWGGGRGEASYSRPKQNNGSATASVRIAPAALILTLWTG